MEQPLAPAIVREGAPDVGQNGPIEYRQGPGQGSGSEAGPGPEVGCRMFEDSRVGTDTV